MQKSTFELHKLTAGSQLSVSSMMDPEEAPKAELQPCSRPRCQNVAAVVMDGKLLCLEHATQEFEQRAGPKGRDH
jgi:hypothetical protein